MVSILVPGTREPLSKQRFQATSRVDDDDDRKWVGVVRACGWAKATRVAQISQISKNCYAGFTTIS